MSVRKHPSKGPGWWQIVKSQGSKGKQKVYVFQGSYAEAISIDNELKGVPAELDEQRLLDVMGSFLDWYAINKATRTFSEAEKMLPKVIARLGNKHLSLLRQSDYDQYKRARLEDKVKKRTINVELSYLRSLLNYARDEMRINVGELPKLYTKKQTLPPAKTPLTPDEIIRLLQELNGDKKTIVMLYAICALRRREPLELKRKHIDLQSGLIHVTGKGDKSRIVPIIGTELLAMLAARCMEIDNDPKCGNDTYLFINRRTGEPYQDLKKGLKLAAKRAGITKEIWAHLLRHSGATAAISAGVGVRELQDMLGHTDIRMTNIYTHMSATMLKDAGNRISAMYSAKNNPSENSENNIPEKHHKLRIVKK